MKKFLSILLAVAMMASFMTLTATIASAGQLVYDFESGIPSDFQNYRSAPMEIVAGAGNNGSAALKEGISASNILQVNNVPNNVTTISFWAKSENGSLNMEFRLRNSGVKVVSKYIEIDATGKIYTYDVSAYAGQYDNIWIVGPNGSSDNLYWDDFTYLTDGEIVEEETTTVPETTNPAHSVQTSMPFASNTVLTPWLHIKSRYPNNTSYRGSDERFAGAADFGEGMTYSSFDTNGFTRTDLTVDISVDTTKNISDYQGYTYFIYIEKLYDMVDATDLTTVSQIRTYFKQNGKATGNNNTTNVKVGQLVQVFVPWSSVSLSDTTAADALSIYPIQAKYTNAVRIKFSVSDFYLYNGGEATFSSVASKYVGGQQAVAWTDGTNIYGAGDTFTPNATKHSVYYVVSGDVATQEGAGVRWASTDAQRGIRFENYVSKSLLDTLGSNNFTIGTLIAPAASVTADNFTHENIADLKAVDVVDPKTYGTTSDGANYRYYGAVVDFEKYFGTTNVYDARTLELAARGYITVTYTDGESATFYSDFDAADHVRSVSDVANAALKDTAANYNDQQIAILEAYCLVEDDTTKPYRTDAADFIS